MITSPSRAHTYEASDQYKTAVVEDMLRGVTDWREVQDIVRLTFKNLLELVKSQGHSLRELERQLQLRPKKSEVPSQVDYSYLTEQVASLKDSCATRTETRELCARLEDKVTQNDLNFHLAGKANAEDLSALSESCTSNSIFEAAVQDFYSRFDRQQTETELQLKKLPSMRDLELLTGELAAKRYVEERVLAIEQSLGTKPDFEWAEKALESKLDAAEMEYKYAQLIHSKADREDIESLSSQLRTYRKDQEEAAAAQTLENTALAQSLHEELNVLSGETRALAATKSDAKELDELASFIQKKIDTETVVEWLRQLRSETSESLTTKFLELKAAARSSEDTFSANLNATALSVEALVSEHSQFSQHFNEYKQTQNIEKQEMAEGATVLLNAQKQEAAAAVDSIHEELRVLHQKVAHCVSAKAGKEELPELANRLQNSLESKTDTSTFNKTVSSLKQELLTLSTSVSEDVKSILAALSSELQSKINQKASTTDLHSLLSEKPDLSYLNRVVSTRTTYEDFNELKRELEALSEELALHVYSDDFEKHVKSTRAALEDVGKDMLAKADIKEVCGILDSKATVTDVNSALSEIHGELDGKAALSVLNTSISDQNLLNEILCSENTVARWQWSSGELRPGSLVPWNSELVNTCPENFIWDLDAPNVVVAAAGLYEVCFGFYSKKKPTVQLLVNGEPILSAVNSSSYIVHHTSGRPKTAATGPVAGLSLIDFLVIPARGRLSVSYTGDVMGEGFLGLKKL